MNDIIFQDENGDILDIMFHDTPKYKKISCKRIRCFCFIEGINDYGYVFCPNVRLLNYRWRRKYDKSYTKK